MIIRYVVAILVATWLLWQIPVTKTDTVRLPELFAATQLQAAAQAEGAPTLFFYRRLEPGQYAAYGLNLEGRIVRALQLPGESAIKPDQSRVSFAGKDGYITGPENGAYFIWYPQLGSQVYVFNERGNLLWEKEESRYLQVLPRGRFVLAAAGDHSRVVFLNPDFQVQADFQGVLFTQIIADDNPDLQLAQACLGSLDGEVILLHLDRKVYARQKLGYALKALACNFATGDMAAIVERSITKEGLTKQVDFLLRLQFDLRGNNSTPAAESLRQTTAVAQVVSEFELPVRTISASAIAVTPQLICFVQAAKTESGEWVPAFYFTPHRTARAQALRLISSSELEANSYDRWRALPIALEKETACLHTHPSGRMLIGSQRGLLLDRADLGGERMLRAQQSYFIQRRDWVYGLR